MGFTVKRVLRRVLRRGSEKAVSRRFLERPLEEYAPLGVRPKFAWIGAEIWEGDERYEGPKVPQSPKPQKIKSNEKVTQK